MLTRLFDEADDGLLTATIVTSITSAVLAAFYFVLRLGFYNPLLPVVSTAGLALLVLGTPATVQLIQQRVGASIRQGWLNTFSAYLLFGLMALCLLGLTLALTPIRAPIVLVLLGFGSFIVHFIRLIRRQHLITILFYFGIGLFAGLWLGGVLWSGDYYSPLYLERLATKQYTPPADTMYHASITSMFQTYGVPSTGLNGLPYHVYHYGSHWVFAQYAHLLALGPLDFYQLGYPVIFAPLFLFSLLVAVIDIGKIYKLPFGGSTSATPIFWLVLIMVLMGYVEDPHYYLFSGSYIVGMCLFMLTIGIVAHAISTQDGLPALTIFIPAMIALMGITKISIGVIAIALSFYFFLRWQLFRRRCFIVGMAAALIIITALYQLTVPNDLEGLAVQNPVNTFLEQIPNAFDYYFVQIFLSWIFIILRLVQKQIRTVGEFWEQLRTNQLIDVEVVAVTALASIGPGVVGLTDTYYFSNVQRWIALLFVLVFIPRFPAMFRIIPAGLPRTLRFASLRSLLLILLFSLWVIRIGYYSLEPIRTAYNDYVMIRYYYSPDLNTRMIIQKALDQDADEVYAAQQEASHQPSFQFLTALTELNNLPTEQKRETLVFIPRTNEVYWNFPFHHCFGASFIAPALTGMALLDGLPDSPSCDSAGFSLPDYEDEVDRLGLTLSEPAKLCEVAQSLGFKQVLVVDADEDGEIITTTLTC